MAPTRNRLPGDAALVDAMLAAVAAVLRVAVAETLAEHSPEPARRGVQAIVSSDDTLPPGSLPDPGTPPPGQTMSLLLLGRWVVGAQQPDGSPAEPEAVLGWIGENVGPRFRSRSRYLIGMLDQGQADEAITLYAAPLGSDFLPCLVWITSALTALYHDGDPAWLETALTG